MKFNFVYLCKYTKHNFKMSLKGTGSSLVPEGVKEWFWYNERHTMEMFGNIRSSICSLILNIFIHQCEQKSMYSKTDSRCSEKDMCHLFDALCWEIYWKVNRKCVLGSIKFMNFLSSRKFCMTKIKQS